MTTQLSTKVITGKVVLQSPHLVRVNTRNMFENSQPKYGTTIIIDKADSETLDKIETAYNNAIQLAGFSNNVKPLLKDGDNDYPFETLYKNSMYLYVSTPLKPKVVDHNLKDLFFRTDEFQSGTYAKVSLEFVPYNFNGKCGISAKLINVQIFPQNKLLELRSRPDEDFTVEIVE